MRKLIENLEFNNFLKHHTLLYGETNTKKTLNTARFIKFLLEEKGLNPREISILDFAPPLTIFENVRIGGKIIDYYKNSKKCRNLRFKGEIVPPRLTSKNLKELFENACKNYKKTSKILNEFNKNPTPLLIINDISIYLHIGNKNLLLDSIKKSSTFFGNTYYGLSIQTNFTSLFNLREKRLVEYFVKKMDYSYFTG
ncbi:MAG: hypothetical protein ACFFHV_22880 [Promethearchaeota archaeon]